MGIYDRDYYRGEQPGFSLRVPRSAVITLIVINAVLFLAELVPEWRVAGFLSAHVGTLTHPWLWWQFLTYGFVHDPANLTHILFNMVALWVLGRDLENFYGTKEFVRLYLVLLVFASVVWATVNELLHTPDQASVLGASGALAGLTVLYAVNFPRRTILFMFVLPMPAWVFGLLVVGLDVLGAAGWTKNTHIAYMVHLAGAGLAFAYYRLGWNFSRLLGGRFHWPRWRLPGRPKLRVHAPEDEAAEDGVPEEEVDRILAKIHREGQQSLTRKERRIMETASRAYQKRRQTGK